MMIKYPFVSTIIGSITCAFFAYIYFKIQLRKQTERNDQNTVTVQYKLVFSLWYALFTIYTTFITVASGNSIPILGPLIVGLFINWRYGLITGLVGGIVLSGSGYWLETTSAICAGVAAGLWRIVLKKRLPGLYQSLLFCAAFIIFIELPLVFLFAPTLARDYCDWRYLRDLFIASSSGIIFTVGIINNLRQEQTALAESKRINGELVAVQAAQRALAKNNLECHAQFANVVIASSSTVEDYAHGVFFDYCFCAHTRKLYFAAFAQKDQTTSSTMALLVSKTIFNIYAKKSAPVSSIVNALRDELQSVNATTERSSWCIGAIDVDNGDITDYATRNFSDISKSSLRDGETLTLSLETAPAYNITITYREIEKTLSLPVALPELDRLKNWLADFAKQHHFSERTAAAIRLSTEELAVNIIKYGFPNGATTQDKIVFALRYTSKRLRITITDSGQPFDPLTNDTKQERNKKTVGGWGIMLARKYSEQLGYESHDGLNVTTVVINTDH